MHAREHKQDGMYGVPLTTSRGARLRPTQLPLGNRGLITQFSLVTVLVRFIPPCSSNELQRQQWPHCMQTPSTI